MDALPKQIDRRIRRAIQALDRPWELTKKRDHYFLRIEGKSLICVASNSSKHNDWQVNRTIEAIRKA